MGLCICLDYFSLFIYSFLSLIALITEELTYHQYKKKGTGIRLLQIAFLEPFVNHPFILYAAIRGNFDYYFNKKRNGEK